MKTPKTTNLKQDTKRFIQINVFIFFLFAILNAFTSCTSEDNIYIDPEEVWQTPLSESLFGTYKNHLGETNKGTVTVSPEKIIIATTEYNYTINLKEDATNFLIAPDCYIEAKLDNKKVLRIDFFPDIERLNIHELDEDKVPTYYGTFDKLKFE